MKNLFIMSIFLSSLFLSGCSSSKAENGFDNYQSAFPYGKVVTASRNYISRTITVKNFTGIQSLGSLDIEYKHSNRPRVELYIPDNVLPCLDIQVKDKILNFGYKRGFQGLRWNGSNKTKITVYSPSVNKLDVTGSGSITIKEPLTVDTFHSFLTGSGSINLYSLKGDIIDCELSGSGEVNILSLQTTKSNSVVRFELTGSGDFKANKVKTNVLNATVTGSGDMAIADISAGSVIGEVTGSGELRMKGRANTASYDVTGSGELKAGQLKVSDVKATATGSGDITCYATGRTNFKAYRSSSIQNVAE